MESFATSPIHHIVALATLSLASGCTRMPRPHEAAARGADVLVARTDAAVTTDRAPSTERLMRELCRDRRCQIEGLDLAGGDGDGRRLTVVRLSELPEPAPGGDAGDDGHCRTLPSLEYWLVVESATALTSQLLLRVPRSVDNCGDLGHTEVFIGDNQITCESVGPSGSAPSESLTMRLSPLRWLRSVRDHTHSSVATLANWEWTQFLGQTHTFEPEEGVVIGDGELADFDIETAPQATHISPLIAVDLPADYLAGGWRSTALGRCSYRVDGGRGGGVTLAGRADAADAELRVVMTRRGEVLAEVLDDHWVGGAQGDRLEVFFASAPAQGQRTSSPRVVSLHLADTRGVLLADEPVAGLSIERAVAALPDRRPSVRFKIALPSLAPSLSGSVEDELTIGAVPLVLVYSDVDAPAARVERRIATSAPPRNRATPEGNFRYLPAESATCAALDGVLEPIFTRVFRRDEPACVTPMP